MTDTNAKAAGMLKDAGYTLKPGPTAGNWKTDLVYGDAARPPVGELVTNTTNGAARLDKGRMTSKDEWKKLTGDLGASMYGDIRFSA